ncbi:MAG: glycosyltransferase family 2 protein [Clostridium sp.]|nr:glycosyltransferase family 2 protein [Clostridium sp.]
MDTLISVITPVFNRADCILKCLESVTSQKCDAGIEHIVVDDGSTDNTFNLIEEYAANHPGTRVFRLDRNSGTNAARNRAVREARGMFILLLDSDDTLAPDSLRFVADTISANPQYREFLFATDDRAEFLEAHGFSAGLRQEFSFHEMLSGKFNTDFAHVVSRDIMLKYPFEEKLRIYEGTFFKCFYKEAGRILFVNHVVLLRDRSRDDRVSYTLISVDKKTMMTSVEAFRLMMRLFYDDFLETSDGRLMLRQYLDEYYRKAVMLGLPDDAAFCETRLGELGVNPSPLYRTLRRFHAGPAFHSVGKYYLLLKYRFGKKPE